MALVMSYRLTIEVAAALTLFVDVHRRPRKANLPNLNIVGQERRATSHTTHHKRRPDASGSSRRSVEDGLGAG